MNNVNLMCMHHTDETFIAPEFTQSTYCTRGITLNTYKQSALESKIAHFNPINIILREKSFFNVSVDGFDFTTIKSAKITFNGPQLRTVLEFTTSTTYRLTFEE